MSDWNLSVVIIVPAALKDKANRLSCALGHDTLPGGTFSVPLSSAGSSETTHYGCRTTAKQEFIDIMTNAGSGEFPDIDLGDFDLSQQDITDILTGQILDVREASEMTSHFNDVLETHGLAIVFEPD